MYTNKIEDKGCINKLKYVKMSYAYEWLWWCIWFRSSRINKSLFNLSYRIIRVYIDGIFSIIFLTITYNVLARLEINSELCCIVTVVELNRHNICCEKDIYTVGCITRIHISWFLCMLRGILVCVMWSQGVWMVCTIHVH